MNKAGLDLLHRLPEGWSGKAYQDIVGVWTIGYGFTKGVKPGQTMNKVQGLARLKREVAEYESAVLDACAQPPNDNECAAMTVLAYNIGVAGFQQSTVLRAHNRGDKQSASRAFGLWNKAGGREIAGLTRRRAAEAALYLAPAGDDPHDMPQRVDPEGSLARSPIAISGGTVGAGGALGLLSAPADDASVLGTAKEWIGDIAGWVNLTPVQMFCLIAAVLGGVILFHRWKQRDKGWT